MTLTLSLLIQPRTDSVAGGFKRGLLAREMIRQTGQNLTGFKGQASYLDVLGRVDPNRGSEPTAKNVQLRLSAPNVFVLDHIRAPTQAATAQAQILAPSQWARTQRPAGQPAHTGGNR